MIKRIIEEYGECKDDSQIVKQDINYSYYDLHTSGCAEHSHVKIKLFLVLSYLMYEMRLKRCSKNDPGLLLISGITLICQITRI